MLNNIFWKAKGDRDWTVKTGIGVFCKIKGLDNEDLSAIFQDFKPAYSGTTKRLH